MCLGHETIIIKAPINVNTMIRKDFSRTFYIRDQTCTFIYKNAGLYSRYILIKINNIYIYVYIYIYPYFAISAPFASRRLPAVHLSLVAPCFCRAIASTAPHNSTTAPHLCAPSSGTECQRGRRVRSDTPRNFASEVVPSGSLIMCPQAPAKYVAGSAYTVTPPNSSP